MSDQKSIIVTDDGIGLPAVEVLTGRGFITGKSGSGKSNSASVIAEELLNNNFPLLIIDTDGEYYGLKEKYEILHLGADEECDIQVNVEHSEKISELALEENIPIILDVSGYLHDDEAKGLITEVARHLFNKEKKLKRPFLMIIEEVHEYIPETKGLDDCGQMLIKIGKRGRKHGLGLCGISQRPADVKKDFITQCDWLVWHRLTWDNDTSVVRRVVGSDYADSIQDLSDGEAFLMTDWDDEIRRVHFRRKDTFDAGATPGLDDFERPDLKSVSSEILSELKEISEASRHKQDEVDQLRTELERKDEQIGELKEEVERAQDVSQLAQQFTEALTNAENGASGDIQATVEEIREEKNEELRELRQEKESLARKNRKLRERVEELEEYAEVADRMETMEQHLDEAAEAYDRLGDALGIEPEEERTAHLKRRIESLQDQVESLRKENSVIDPESLEYQEFVENEAVQAQIEAAKKDATSPRYVKGVIASILRAGGPVTYDQIAKELDINTTSHVATAVNALHDQGVVTKSKEGRETQVNLNVKGIREIQQAAARRNETNRIMGEI